MLSGTGQIYDRSGLPLVENSRFKFWNDMFRLSMWSWCGDENRRTRQVRRARGAAMRRAFSSTGAGLHQKGEVDAREGWALNVETGKLVQLIPVTACGPDLIPL